jgi:hypothetical protein
MVEPYFVTLTAPRVTQEKLKQEIEHRQNVFTKIMGVMRKRSTMIEGIRKLETTYKREPKGLTYHPHFHVLIEGKAFAEALVSEWLKRMPNAKKWAQDCKPADIHSLRELFKYATKPNASLSKDDKAKEAPVSVHAIHTINLALYRKRTLQPFGDFGKGIRIREAEDMSMQLNAQEYEGACAEDMEMVWAYDDWYGTQTGEALSGYKPTQKDIKKAHNIETQYPYGTETQIQTGEASARETQGRPPTNQRRRQRRPLDRNSNGDAQSEAIKGSKAKGKRGRSETGALYAHVFRELHIDLKKVVRI